MHLDSRGGVSVAELVIFVPVLLASLPICMRHGFNRSSGWVFTLVLCIIRIIGAACQLGTYSNKSTSLFRATLVFDSIGLTPLLLATLGLLARVINWVQIREQQLVGLRELRLVRLLVFVSLILSIAGGSTSKFNVYNTYKPVSVSSSSQAAIILYIISFIGICYLVALSAKHRSSVPIGEIRILYAVLLAMPLILIRLIYAALVIFRNSKVFNYYNGSVAALVCMSVLEEFIVVILYVILGYVIPLMIPDQQAPSATADIFRNEMSQEFGTQNQNAQRTEQEAGFTQESAPTAPPPTYVPLGGHTVGEEREQT